jgi:hypothetical protein
MADGNGTNVLGTAGHSRAQMGTHLNGCLVLTFGLRFKASNNNNHRGIPRAEA